MQMDTSVALATAKAVRSKVGFKEHLAEGESNSWWPSAGQNLRSFGAESMAGERKRTRKTSLAAICLAYLHVSAQTVIAAAEEIEET